MGLAGIVAIMLIMAGCQKKNQLKPDESVLASFDRSIVAKRNDFGFSLYQKLINENENMMISPVGVTLAMDMAYNGAEGETKAVMAKALNIQGIDTERLNKNNRALLYLLTSAEPKVILNIADSLWLDQSFEFSEPFRQTVKDNYQAQTEELDFSDPKSADTINKWVKDKTAGVIDQIVDAPIDSETMMFLINTVYFKGAWTSPFDQEQTSEQNFKTGNGQTVATPMMFQSGAFDYLKTVDFQAVRLPYGDEQKMAMILFLPNEESSLVEFQGQLNQENWSNWMNQLAQKEGTIMLPRLTLTTEESLKQALTDLGMGVAFEAGKADFSGMTTAGSGGDIKISDVKHKTYLQVDERGTEAAAATSVEIGLTSMPTYDFELRFDRPFFYAIQDRETGAIIFLGSVSDPGK
ncbi:proteinase inhibitor I4, serpin [Acetobacterium woodii DSM 1030]|uniref:Proteinase inhibitor I4, serpin n=2 Tax=Acetobacterium woodii TaxID=33952 RepID=H6LJ24_ACEWD|nr:proteinase inhibitor I4, serpin [Acetobacterium woodii DSM 1030]